MVRIAVWRAALLVLLLSPFADAESRFADVHMATDRQGYVPFVHGEGFDEVNGVFVSDPEAKRLRFDVAANRCSTCRSNN